MSKRFRPAPFLALTVLLLLPARATAGTATLLRDIADGPAGNASPAARQLTPFKDGVAFLAAPPGSSTPGVWVSDGTGPGTRLVHAGCQAIDCRDSPEILGVVNGFLLFSVPGDGPFDLRLWSSDGTRAGTLPLAPDDLDLTVGYRAEGAPIVVSAKALYFLACPDAGRCGIWQSDGTPAGTRLLQRHNDLDRRLVLAGDRLYTSTGNGELFVYDTKTGGSAVFDGGDDLSLLTPVGGRLFYVKFSFSLGDELWVSDGTAAGTRALKHGGFTSC
jgi:hypothetical protein